MTFMPMLVCVHSPLLGPLSWEPTAKSLRRFGYPVVVPSLAAVTDGAAPFYRRFAETVVRAIGESRPEHPAVLIGHSAAGELLPAIAEQMERLHAAVFVDAIIPHPGAAWFDTASPELRDQLLTMERAGRLPPWNEWFPSEELAALIPAAEMRSRFIAELPRIPLGYFEEPAPAVPDLPPRRCAYLQLSGAYGPQADECERRGWTVYRKDIDHLAMLTKPELVAPVLDEIVSEMPVE